MPAGELRSLASPVCSRTSSTRSAVRPNRDLLAKGCMTPWLACAAIHRFSATVIESNTLLICSDRLMPRRLIRCGAIPEISVPRNFTVPESDLSMPEIVLNRVVFPAPFGPMIACSTSGSKSSVTRSSATRPPKRLVRLSISRMGAFMGRLWRRPALRWRPLHAAVALRPPDPLAAASGGRATRSRNPSAPWERK